MKRQEIPPRNWKRWGLAYASHWLVGAVLGVLIAGLAPVVGCAGLAIILVYQWVEFLRRGDTPARDILDYGVGFAVGAAGYAVWSLI